MVDFNLLISTIKAKGLKMEFIASEIGLSRQGLYLRFRNKTEFTASEITKLAEILQLTPEEKEAIFFATELNEIQPVEDIEKEEQA